MVDYCSDAPYNMGKHNADIKVPSVKTDLRSSSNVQACFREYNLEDKVQALKNLLDYNDKNVYVSKVPQAIKLTLKKKVGIKECLQPEQLTPFQSILWELKNTTMDSYWNKQVGKTRYQIPHLPVGLNPLETTFGMKTERNITAGELINPHVPEIDLVTDDVFHDLYKKTHNNYYPSEQIEREYKSPFSKNTCFGKPSNVNVYGGKVKRLMTWINPNPVTLVNSIQGEFLDRTKSYVGITKNPELNTELGAKLHGTSTAIEQEGAQRAIRDCFLNDLTLLEQDCLKHVNTIRQSLKTRVPETPFLDIYQDLYSLDKSYSNILPKEEVYEVLAKYKIHPDRTLFEQLLFWLRVCKNEHFYYKTLVDLLNWRCKFPNLPKLNDIPKECHHYLSTYQDTIGREKQEQDKSLRSAGLPSTRTDVPFIVIPRQGIRADVEHLGDQTSAYSLIWPSIFTNYNLSHIDFYKIRNKEEIQSIFENIGIEFPENSFDIIWQEASKKDGTGGVCVETFRNILAKYTSHDN